MIRLIATMIACGLWGSVIGEDVKQMGFVYQHVTVVDETGTHPDMAVVIVGERISAIGSTGELALPEDAHLVDATGKYMIPGLWDMHVHWTSEEIPLYLANGVTGVRVMHGRPDIIATRDAGRNKQYLMPRIVVSSPQLDGPKKVWSKSIALASPEDARQMVRKIQKQGYDFAKTYSNLPREVFLAILKESQELNYDVAGHVPSTVKMSETSTAGLKSIEHLNAFYLECSRDETKLRKEVIDYFPYYAHQAFVRARRTVDGEASMDLIRLLARNKTTLVPTLSAMKELSSVADKGFGTNDRMPYYPPRFAATRRQPSQRHLERVKFHKQALEQDLSLVANMYRAGVPLMAGTDGGIGYVLAGFGLHDELELLAKAGIPPRSVLRMATIRPAEFLGRKEVLGTIEAGKLADVVVLDADPLRDISNTRRIAEVVTRGHRLTRMTLDKMLEQSAFANVLRQRGGKVSQNWDYEGQVTTSVDLRSREVDTKDFSALRALERVRALTLSFTKITDDELKYLRGMKDLRTLWLTGTNVTDAGIHNLLECPQLRFVGLAKTGVTDEGLAQLVGLTELRGLYLSGTSVTDAGLRHLYGMKSLQALFVIDTSVSEAAIVKLKSRLPNLKVQRRRDSDDG